MNYEMFYDELKEKMSKIDIDLSDSQVKQFYDYMLFLLEWNEKINLTAITDESEIILKHFVDSASICKYIKKEDIVLDLGTGAGFPGIPIKILNPEIKITLVDSLNKRIIFLNQLIEMLELENIVTIHARAEELARNKKYRENFDIVCSRAVAPMNILAEYTIPFVKIGGKLISMKGSNSQEEIEVGEKAISVLGGTVTNVHQLILPDSDMERNIIIIEKIKGTPKQYPRKAGTPKSKPII